MTTLLLAVILLLLLQVLVVVVHGQQVPLYNVDNDESVRTNFCERHNMVENGVIAQRRDALKGMQIKAALLDYQLDPSYNIIPEIEPSVGIVFLDAVASRAGFTWRDTFGVQSSPVNNETWDDVLYSANKKYDMVGEWFWRTITRMSNGQLFPEGWFDGSLIMVGKTSDFHNQATFDLWACLAPFSASVWYLTLATLVASAAVFHLILYIENYNHKRAATTMMNPVDSFFVTAFSFTGHYFFLPRTNATRIYSCALCALALMMLSAYTANLASFLVMLNQPTSSINEIKDAVAQRMTFCVYSGSFSENYMTTKYPSARLLPVVNDDESLAMIDAGKCDIALVGVSYWETAKRDATLNGDCNKKWIGRVVKFQQAGFPIGDSQGLCTSLLRDVIELIIIDMKDDGSFDRLWNDIRKKKDTNGCYQSSNGDADDGDNNNDSYEDLVQSFRLDVNNVGGMFIFYGIALVIALLFALSTPFMEYLNDKGGQQGFCDMITRRSGMRGGSNLQDEVVVSSTTTTKKKKKKKKNQQNQHDEMAEIQYSTATRHMKKDHHPTNSHIRRMSSVSSRGGGAGIGRSKRTSGTSQTFGESTHSGYTDEVFTTSRAAAEGTLDPFEAVEMEHAMAFASGHFDLEDEDDDDHSFGVFDNNNRGGVLVNDVAANPLIGLHKLLQEKEARDKRLQQEINFILSKVASSSTESEIHIPPTSTESEIHIPPTTTTTTIDTSSNSNAISAGMQQARNGDHDRAPSRRQQQQIFRGMSNNRMQSSSSPSGIDGNIVSKTSPEQSFVDEETEEAVPAITGIVEI